MFLENVDFEKQTKKKHMQDYPVGKELKRSIATGISDHIKGFGF